MARKSKYQKEILPNLKIIEELCAAGATDKIIAEKLNIALSTFYEYKKKYKEFSDALKRGKDEIDTKVENALLKRALGYDYDQITYEHGIETKRVTKHILPDTTAQIFWLKNRKPAEWRDKQDHDNEEALSKLDELLEAQKNA